VFHLVDFFLTYYMLGWFDIVFVKNLCKHINNIVEYLNLRMFVGKEKIVDIKQTVYKYFN